jgi:hypothetical protein
MNMRATLIPFLLAGLAVPVAWGQQLPATVTFVAPQVAFSHYDPVALNESAMERVRQGDLSTALILLERASRLAPHDPRIARNLRELQAYRTGTPAPAEAPATGARPGPGPVIPAEPPAIWPLQ